MPRTPRAPRATTVPAPSAAAAQQPSETTMPTVSDTASMPAPQLSDLMAAAFGSYTPEPTPEPAPTQVTAIVPVPASPASPLAYASSQLRALLAGGDLEIDPDLLAAAITQMERGMQAPAPASAPRTSTGKHKLYEHEPAAQRAAAVASGLPTRKIWRTKAYGPFLVGACNAAGGAVVRDTRESYPASDVWAGQKVSTALAWLRENHPEATTANATPEALARIAADGVAR